MNLNSFTGNRRNVTSDYFKLKVKNSSKGKSRTLTVFTNSLPINFKHKKLTIMFKSSGGRNASGQKTLRTRGTVRRKLTKLSVNFTYRSLNTTFIAGFFLTPLYNKLLSLLFLSSGSVSYITTTSEHALFTVRKLYPLTTNVQKQFSLLHGLHPLI